MRDRIYCKRRNDLEVQGLEAAWVEKTLLVGGFYRPPNSNAACFELISESIDTCRAYNTNIIDIFILGDFNYNILPTRGVNKTMMHYRNRQLQFSPRNNN